MNVGSWNVLGPLGWFKRVASPNLYFIDDVDVSENSGTPKSSILIGFSIIHHPFWGTPIFGNTHVQLGCH